MFWLPNSSLNCLFQLPLTKITRSRNSLTGIANFLKMIMNPELDFLTAHKFGSHESTWRLSLVLILHIMWPIKYKKTSQVTYVTMVPRVGNETLRPLGVATGNASAWLVSEDTYLKTPPVGRRQPMTSLPACHNISAAGRLHHQLLRLKLASEAWPKA